MIWIECTTRHSLTFFYQFVCRTKGCHSRSTTAFISSIH